MLPEHKLDALLARHKLVVKGLIKHPLTSLRFIALVSIVG